jgi:hypothetical protein
MTPFALPGCALAPWNVTTASRAFHVSWLISPQRLAVHRVGVCGAECRDVELIDADADLFVGREADRDRTAWNPRVLQQRVRERHDRGHAGLVVRSEQRRPVRGDDVVAEVGRERGGRDHLRRVAGQDDVAAAVVRMDDRAHVPARDGRRRVHVGEEADDGRRPASRAPGPARASVHWPSVLGTVGSPSRDCVSRRT